MNKKRRERLDNVCSQIEVLAQQLIDILEEEQNYYDNIPENLQESIMAEESEEFIDLIETVIDDLDELKGAI